MADKLDSPGPTPEALVSVKLRRVEENQPVVQTQELIRVESNRMNDGRHHEAADEHDEEVRSNRQKLELSKRPL